MAKYRFARRAALAGLCLALAACGGEGETAQNTGATGSAEAAAAGCTAFSDELIRKWGLERQLVLNLAMAGGNNLKTLRETAGVPDPATFRAMADAFRASDFSGVEPLDMFDAPDVIAAHLTRTADLLSAALAAGGDTQDVAWTALSEFYTQGFFVRHNASVTYYLGEMDCI